MDTFLSILFILICVLLIGIILLQKGRGGGLSGAFGGVGGHSAFGTRTGDMFTWITVVLVGLFLLVATVTVRKFRPVTEQAVAAPQVEQAAPAEEQVPATQPADEAETKTDTEAPAATQPAEAADETK